MGLCLSHCGQAQHKAAVVAVSISGHQSSASPARPSRISDQGHVNASQSLKRFLHLYREGSEGRKLSPRGSLDNSLAVPHSSELFSLPSEGESECDDCCHSRSSSPARGSVTSGLARPSIESSPSGRTSVGVRSGRSEKPPVVPRSSNGKKVNVALESCTDHGRVTEPEKSLVETITRLEKFCDVKLFLEKRSSVRRNSAHELSATNCAQESSILLHNSCRDLALKLLCFSNEHARHISHGGDGDLSRSVRRCDSAKEMTKSHSPEVRECLPLEKSVASFLEEVENFVSKVDASADQRPAEHFTKGERESEGVSRLPSLRFQDANEKIQFTDFEASFELPRSKPATETNPSDRSLQTDHPSTQDTQDQQASLPSVSVECELTGNSAPVALRRPAHRHSRTTSGIGGAYHIDVTTEQEKIPKKSMLRLAFTEIDANVIPARDSLARVKVRTSMGQKRGVTRSLDLQDSSIPQLAFGTLKRPSTQEAHTSTEDSPLVRNSGCPDAAATPSGDDSQCSEAADSATSEQFAHEGEGDAAPPPADAAPSQPQPTKGRSSVDSKEPIDQESVVRPGDANAGGETSDLQGTDTGLPDQDSEKSLSMTFDNLFKLLQSPAAELAQSTSALLELLGAQPSGAIRKSSVNGSHLSEAGIAPEMQAGFAHSLCEAENWHDAPASLSTTEQSELHNSTQ